MALSHEELIGAIEKKGPFSPGAHYVARGDVLHVWFTGEPSFSQSVAPTLHIHRSNETGQIVGCTVLGVSGVIKK